MSEEGFHYALNRCAANFEHDCAACSRVFRPFIIFDLDGVTDFEVAVLNTVMAIEPLFHRNVARSCDAFGVSHDQVGRSFQQAINDPVLNAKASSGMPS